MENLTVFYRISDKGNPKNRMKGLDYKKSLDNFIKEFNPAQIEVTADNVEVETKKMITSL